MTLQELAEREYPEYLITDVERERAGFIKGLQVGMEFAEWAEWRYSTGLDHLWYENGCNKPYTTEELFEIFIKEKQCKQMN
jgi:hypothetical protein